MSHLYQVTTFKAHQLQKLRNVTIHSPSLIQIVSGSKRLFLNQDNVDLAPSTLLLCEASSRFSFENLPGKGTFLSRVFSFHLPASESLIELSQKNARTPDKFWVSKDKAIEQTLNVLHSLNLDLMSVETQRLWLAPLYQQLAERGALHHLFTSEKSSFTQQLSHYLARSPNEAHPLEETARHFSISRATFIRRLKKESTQYRDVLTEVRLNHALNLMQTRAWSVLQLAYMCGYQSEQRFSQRFRSKFGLTPGDYMQTIERSSSETVKAREH